MNFGSLLMEDVLLSHCMSFITKGFLLSEVVLLYVHVMQTAGAPPVAMSSTSCYSPAPESSLVIHNSDVGVQVGHLSIALDY